MSYRADKLGVDARARTHTQTDAGNDNTRRPKLASGKKYSYNNHTDIWITILVIKMNFYVNSQSQWIIGLKHYNDITMSAMASQFTSHTMVYSPFIQGADQRKHQSSASQVCEGNSPVTGEFPARRASYPENAYIVNTSEELGACFFMIICVLLLFFSTGGCSQSFRVASMAFGNT